MKILKISQSNIEEAVDDSDIFNIFQRLRYGHRILWRPEQDKWMAVGNPLILYRRAFLGNVLTGQTSTTITNPIASYRLNIDLHIGNSKTEDIVYIISYVSLYFNPKMSSYSSDFQRIAKWTISGDDSIKGDQFNDLLSSELGLRNLKLPHVLEEEKEKSMEGKIQKRVRLTRTKSRPRNREATSLEIFIEPKRTKGHDVYYQVTFLETSVRKSPELIKDRNDKGEDLNAEEAMAIFNNYVLMAKENGYVDETSMEYIPEGSNRSNFDFDLNESKEDLLASPETEEAGEIEKEFGELMSKNKKTYRVSQNFEGYFSGNVPDYATQFLGSSAVEASQISSMFGKASEAVNLVNQFNSSLLYNISFIFNFAKSGAYGVYLSELDRAIKTKALQKKLEQKGYEVKTTEQGLTAFPKKDTPITPEAIQKDIDSIYADLESKGGTAIGINMNAVLNAAKQDAMEAGSQDPEIWQWIAILHLGGTIAHEAIHAKGSMSEDPSGQAEQAFTQWALPKINEEYKRSLESQGKGDQFVPLIVTGRQRHAVNKSWYKTAQQLSYYIPHSFVESPIGSDLRGRFPTGLQSETAMQSWSMLAQDDQDIPIERKLGRQYMSTIPKDLNQEHDSIEEQLRKYTREDKKLDPKASMEVLLSEGWDEDRGYTTIEGLLDEKRPKPLMVTFKKGNSDGLVKTANKTLKLTPFMTGEISVDFEDYEGHYDDPNGPEANAEKVLYGKLTSNNFNFTDEELIMIGGTLNSIGDKDAFRNINGKKQLFDVELQLGMWTPITDEEARLRVRSGLNVRMGNFPKVNGIRYDYNHDWENQFVAKPISNPVVVPLTSSSHKMTKTATLFGWMNNLQISDGNTIPGLGDRVMAWDDRDEDFSQEEEWIKQQPRYNPTYDIKGFYYRWIEPRFQPQFFDDMTRDYSGTHPAKRFASATKIEPEVAHILSILARAKSNIAKGNISSTRFIVTEDVMPIIEKIFPDGSFKIHVFHYGATDTQEDIFAVWISSPDVQEDNIERAEKHLQNKSVEKEADTLIDQLTGISSQRTMAIKEIIDMAKDISYDYEIKDLSIVGAYPRDVSLKSSSYLINNIEFRGGWSDQCIKIGGIMAEKLGVQNVDMNHNRLSFVYKGITVSFSDDSIPLEISAGLREQGIDSENEDLYNRDFTVNMLSYNISENKISDITGRASDDIKNKILRTFFDPNYVCSQNPIVILRALKLKIRHNMEIDPLLQKAMRSHSELIFDGRYSERDLIVARENVREEGKKEADELFKVFGLEDLNKIK